MVTPLSREKLVVARKKEVIKCPRCDYVMDFVEAYRPYGDGPMILTDSLFYLRRRRLCS